MTVGRWPTTQCGHIRSRFHSQVRSMCKRQSPPWPTALQTLTSPPSERFGTLWIRCSYVCPYMLSRVSIWAPKMKGRRDRLPNCYILLQLTPSPTIKWNFGKCYGLLCRPPWLLIPVHQFSFPWPWRIFWGSLVTCRTLLMLSLPRREGEIWKGEASIYKYSKLYIMSMSPKLA